MKANQAAHSLTTMCRVLGVSASGYHAWRQREASARAVEDVELLEQIRRFHRRSRGTYGAPRLHRDLRAAGVRVGRKRVARLLKQAGLRGVSRRKWPVTTVRAEHARPAPDLVQRAFSATGPNQLWVADITYIPTWAGTLFLAVVLDVWSRRIIGWAMATHLRTSLALAALELAIEQRRPAAVIHHSDQGCQYTAIDFGRRCREANVRPSMGSVGDCYDNAMCEASSRPSSASCSIASSCARRRTPVRRSSTSSRAGTIRRVAIHRSTTSRRWSSNNRRADRRPTVRAERRRRRDKRPVEAVGPMENAQNAFPTGPWRTLRVLHKSHRPSFLFMTKEKNRKR